MQGDAYKVARSGGKHHGWYLNQTERPDAEIENGIRSFERQIERHAGWGLDPASKVARFRDLRPEHQAALIAGWRQDMDRHRDCIDILRGMLKERDNG